MLKVRDLMTDSPDTVAPGDNLREVLAKMNRDGCRHLPVVEQDALVGIISDRDVRLAVNSPMLAEEEGVYREAILEEIRVESCMTPNPITAGPDDAACEVADMLSLYKFGGLPVLENGRLTGMITTVDFLRYVARLERS